MSICVIQFECRTATPCHLKIRFTLLLSLRGILCLFPFFILMTRLSFFDKQADMNQKVDFITL